MSQIFSEIEEDLKKDKFLNLYKKYKVLIIITISLIFLTIVFIVSKNILFESRSKKNTQEYVIILNLIYDKKIEEAKKRLNLLKESQINLYRVLIFLRIITVYELIVLLC